MKCMTVYHAGGKWYGSQIEWKRSGSGTYRETSLVEIPQSRPAIEAFAADNGFSIEWRGPIPEESGAPAPAAT